MGLPSRLLASMTLSADAVVDQVLLHGSTGMRMPPRTEVGFVAAITLGGVRGIWAAWEPLLKPYGCSLKMQGVFCHAAPVVEFAGPSGTQSGCELADLLIVVDHIDPVGQVRRRASLIQAKMASKAKRVSLNGPSSKKQLHLFQHWPSFRFRDPVYGASSYILTSVGTGESGTFGVIDRHFKRPLKQPPKWTQHSAKPTPHRITTEPTLGGFIAQMIGSGARKFGRVASPGGTDDWSRVVDLLLNVTFQKAFKYAPSLGSLQSPRGVTAMAYLPASTTGQGRSYRPLGLDWQPPFDGFETIEDDDPGGINVLRVEVSQDVDL